MVDIAPSVPREIPAGRVARGTVEAPPSKSHAIRALICAALAGNLPDGDPFEVHVSLDESRRWPEDVLDLADALGDLGWEVYDEPGGGLSVGGTGGRIPSATGTASVGSSATALRFLAAVCALGPGPYTITGSPQLLRRPAGAIVPALRALGVSVEGECGGGDGVRPPLVISGGPPRGRDVTVDASESSHVVSALLLIAPLLPEGLRIRTAGAVVSRPYIDLTVRTMRRDLGVAVEERPDGWEVAHGSYDPSRYCLHSVEGDWSSAAYLLAAGAATGGDVVVSGLDERSPQPDRRIVEILAAFDALAHPSRDGIRCRGRVSRPVDVDLSDSPDLAPLVGALGCLVEGTTRVRGAAHLRIKETDRIAAVVRCARALGCVATEHPDGFEVTGPARHGALIDPEGDHRIAMAFAVAGLAVPGTRIAEPDCVAKSYPTFWQDLESLVA